MSVTGTVPVKVLEKTGDYEVYGLLAAGLAAARPAPGIVDRFYFSTDTVVLERDTGAAWVEVVRGEAAIRLAQLAEKAHGSLTGVIADQHHTKYTDAEAQAIADARIVIHAAIEAAHHARYTDAEAVAVANALIAIHAALTDAHHARSHDHSLAADGSPIAVAGVPNLDAAKITSGTFAVARGGTGLNTIALGGILYASALDVLSRLAPTAANQVLRSTAANALQFAALLAADIPNLDATKITSGVFALARIPNMDWAHISGLFPRTIAQLLSDHNLANHPLAIIPVMDWAHISGLFPRTIAALLSDHDLAHHPLAIIPTMDDGHIPDLETLSYGGAFAVAQIPGLPASQITSGQFPLSRMPRAASGLFLEGNGAADPIYNALIAANIPNLPASKITSGQFPLNRMPRAASGFLRGKGVGVNPAYEALVAGDIPNLDAAKIVSGVFALARIPNMDWAHISGLFPRTIADLLSDHNLANHVLGTVVPHDALASLTEKAHGSLTGVSANQHHPQSHNAASHSDIASSGANIDDAVAKKHAQAHTLASHSTKAHTELTGVTANQHHPQAHTLASHSTKAHTELTGVTAAQHHAKYTDTEAQNTVKANVEVGDLKAPTKALAMNSQKVTGLLAPTAAGDALRKGTRVTVTELPAMTAGKIWRGTGASPEEIAMPVLGGIYDGAGSVNKAIAHGLGRAPKIVIIIQIAGEYWYEIFFGLGYIFYQAGATIGRHAVTAPDATNFYVGNSDSYAQSANSSLMPYKWVAIG